MYFNPQTKDALFMIRFIQFKQNIGGWERLFIDKRKGSLIEILVLFFNIHQGQ